MAADELVVDATGDVGHREPAVLLGDRGVELDLVEQVAELFDDVLVRRRVVRVEGAQRVDQLVGLLQQVAHQGLVVLLAVPRALLAQRAGELVEADQLGADRLAEVGDVDAREVVGLDGAVELGPRRADDRLLGRAEALEDDDLLVARRGVSTASLMSLSTQLAWVWATSSGPARPAAAVANSWPSISVTRCSTGSMPSAA